jgi:NADH-quinone oxidoreductase subunit M
MIAYSSVGHMGFVLLGFATLTPVGINAALFGNIAHGVITGLLFFLAGAVKERYGTADLAGLGGGMLGRVPWIASLLTFAAVASLGLPGLAGFWGEMLALLGAYQPAEGLSRPLFLVFMVAGGVGTLLTAAYYLVMLSRVTHGRPDEPVARPGLPEGEPVESAQEVADVLAVTGARGEPVEPVAVEAEVPVRAAPLPDARPGELVAWVPLVVLAVLLGLWPKALLSLTDPAVQAFLGAP